jgi:membrane protein YqaA with SNARE-associated domain
VARACGWRIDIDSGDAFNVNVTSLVASSGYAAIFLLSFLQSCCVPTSSELTLGFAGVLAAEGKLSLAAVIAVGAAGELVGAYVAWFAGKKLGRGFVDRFGRYVLLSHADLDRAEAWYERHPQWGVFGSRLLPVIRNFVAVPAGIAEVPAIAIRGPYGCRITDLGRRHGGDRLWRGCSVADRHARIQLRGLPHRSNLHPPVGCRDRASIPDLQECLDI